MNLEELRIKVSEWDLRLTGTANDASFYSTILNQLDYHAKNEWRVYLPAEHPDFQPSYMDRLASWVGNLTDEDEQKLILEYALYISFFSHDDFIALYRTAVSREATRWIAEQIGVRLEHNTGQQLSDSVYREMCSHTWFCPVTDSMDINEFYKVNHLRGAGHRPGFAPLQMLAEAPGNPDPEIAKNVLSYMANPSLDPCDPYPPLERIVLLEDLVGSGSQCLETIKWVMEKLAKPTLFIPLILCPNGKDALAQEEKQWNGLFTVRPIIELRRSDLLGPERRGHKGWRISSEIEGLARRYCSRLDISPGRAFGYMGTGCSLVTFSNTPDNSLPIIHRKPSHGNWEPLFPRVHRGI